MSLRGPAWALRRAPWRETVLGTVAALAVGAGHAAAGGGRPPDLLGMAHVNSSTAHVAFEIDRRQRHVSEIRVRSGSLALHVLAVELTFSDGGHARFQIDETLPPGHASRPLPVDRLRPLAEVAISKRPGLRPGETTIQLLGKVETIHPSRALPSGR